MTLLKADPLDLPWRVSEYDPCMIEDSKGDRLIQDGGWDADWVDLWPAQRDLIVRAVNAHEALVEVLRELTEDVTGELDVDAMMRFGDAMDRARKLLASLD
jgi:hypothetical protein